LSLYIAHIQGREIGVAMVKKLLMSFAVVMFGLAVNAAQAGPSKAQYRLAGSIEAGAEATKQQQQTWNHFFKLADVVTGEEFYAFTFQVEKYGKYQVSFVADDVVVQAKAIPMEVINFQSHSKHRFGVVVPAQLVDKIKTSAAAAVIFGKENGLATDMTRLAL
jgi:hypothetical protein